MKQKIKSLIPYLPKLAAVVAVFSLYTFLFGDFFDVYYDEVGWYAICATYLTIYLYGKKSQ